MKKMESKAERSLFDPITCPICCDDQVSEGKVEA